MMRRFGLYILAALFTFGIGSFIAVKFYRQLSDNSAAASPAMVSPQRYKSADLSKPSSEADEKGKTLFCEDKEILTIWKELINDKTFWEWQPVEGESLNCADMVEIRQADLNEDNQKEILVRGRNISLCSPVGNCAFWIFERKGKSYKKILYSTDYYSETPDQIKKTSTKGYSDILLKGHFSASDTTYNLYKFDGKKYRENRCSVQAYVPGTSADPQWEFISCKEYYSRNK
jgi:hypothetical protein